MGLLVVLFIFNVVVLGVFYVASGFGFRGY